MMSQPNDPFNPSEQSATPSQQFPQAPRAPQYSQGQQFSPTPGQYTPSAPVAPGTVPPAPKQHRQSVLLFVASLVVGLISGIITLFSIDAIIEAQIATMGSSLPSGQNHDSLKAVAIGAAIFGLIFSVLIQGLFILFWHLGHGWARIVLTVLAAFTVWNLISSFLTLGQTPVGISLLSILSDLLFLAGAYLAWNKSITAWLQQRKAARTAAMYAG